MFYAEAYLEPSRTHSAPQPHSRGVFRTQPNMIFLFLFLVMLSNFFIIPMVKDKIQVKLAPAIITGAPTTQTK